MKPTVLVLADVIGWAWDRKAQAYRRYLSDEFDVTVGYYETATHLLAPRPPRFGCAPDRVAVDPLPPFDLVHLFEVRQLDAVPYAPRYPGKIVAGLTAHVWPTWGEARMRAWAARVDALHGNSRLLVDDLRNDWDPERRAPFHARIAYLPNGVDPAFWRRLRPSPTGTVVGHVGKPNPRKGASLIVEACERAGVEVRLVQRSSQVHLTREEMLDWYQAVNLQVTFSDLDGTPNPMLESAACGNALASNPIGNMPEFIAHGQNGLVLGGPGAASRWGPYFVRQRGRLGRRELDPPARALAVDALTAGLAWCREYHDALLDMGAAARETVLRDWTWERQVEDVRRFWRAVLGGEGGVA